MFRSSFGQHIRDNKTAYIAGGLAMAALGAGYFWSKSKTGGSNQGRSIDYFPAEYSGTPGISQDLAKNLNQALKASVDYDIKLWLMPEEGKFKGVSELIFETNPEFSDDLYISAHSLIIS